jgi:hypothetical protein
MGVSIPGKRMPINNDLISLTFVSFTSNNQSVGKYLLVGYTYVGGDSAPTRTCTVLGYIGTRILRYSKF